MTRTQQRKQICIYLESCDPTYDSGKVWTVTNIAYLTDIITRDELEYIAAWILNPLDGRPLAKVIDWTFENTLENKEE